MRPHPVGFWATASDPKSPVPEHSDLVWSGKSEFLSALRRLEHRIMNAGQARVYRGFSKCRCCGAANGNMEFEIDDWSWPSGYAHYVAEHNVCPPEEFYAFVLEEF